MLSNDYVLSSCGKTKRQPKTRKITLISEFFRLIYLFLEVGCIFIQFLIVAFNKMALSVRNYLNSTFFLGGGRLARKIIIMTNSAQGGNVCGRQCQICTD